MGCTHSKKMKSASDNELPKEKSTNSLKEEMSDLSAPLCISPLQMMGASKGPEKLADGTPALIADRYKLSGDAVACGAFGCIYQAIDLKEPDEKGKLYAVKVEHLDCDYPQLGHEARMYKVLEGSEGIPRGYAYEEKENMAILVMDMLGDSLQKLFEKRGKVFSVKTCLMLAEQMLTRVQYLHEMNYVHRDLKPANFVVGYPGTKQRNTVFILDFGLTKKWRNHLTKEIRPFEQRYYGAVGTPMFASHIADQGMEQARKDDLESLGYILLYFLQSLPWANIDEGMETDAYLDKIVDQKKNLPLEQYPKTIPREFMEYLMICRGMKFAQDPDYEYLKNLFRNCAKKLGIAYPYDNKFDWN